MDVLQLLMGLASQQDPREAGIEMLKRRMGGDAPWYMNRTPPGWVKPNMNSQAADAIDTSNSVPRRYGP